MRGLVYLLFGSLRRSFRSRSKLVLENLALRQQLAMYRRPPQVRDADRLFWSTLARIWTDWPSALLVIRPETVVRWHRAGFRRYWRWRSRRGGGRPRIPLEVRELIARMAQENPRWGAVRIQAELRALGYEVSAETVRRYRLRALRRPPSQRWQTFLSNHRTPNALIELGRSSSSSAPPEVPERLRVAVDGAGSLAFHTTSGEVAVGERCDPVHRPAWTLASAAKSSSGGAMKGWLLSNTSPPSQASTAT